MAEVYTRACVEELEAEIERLRDGIEAHRKAHSPDVLHSCSDDRRLWALLDGDA